MFENKLLSYDPNEINDKKVKIVDKKKIDQDKLKQLEEGFNIYLSGANKERVDQMRKKEQIERNMRNNNNHDKRSANCQSVGMRKKWNNANQNPLILKENNYFKGPDESLYTLNLNTTNAFKEYGAVDTNQSQMSRNENRNDYRLSKESFFNIEDIIQNMHQNNNLSEFISDNYRVQDAPPRQRRGWGQPVFQNNEEKSLNMTDSEEKLRRKELNTTNYELKSRTNIEEFAFNTQTSRFSLRDSLEASFFRSFHKNN